MIQSMEESYMLWLNFENIFYYYILRIKAQFRSEPRKPNIGSLPSIFLLIRPPSQLLYMRMNLQVSKSHGQKAAQINVR